MNTMRKSRYVTVLLAGAALAALSGCDDNNVMTGKDETLYPSAEACSAERDAGECTAAFETAKAEHVKQAPKFSSKEECEAAGYQVCEVGQVVNREGGGSGSYFMPMMMGYLMARSFGGGGMIGGYGLPPQGGPAQTQSAPGRSGAATGAATGASAGARPVYGDRNGYLYTGGSPIGRTAPGTTSLGSRGIAMAPTSRGGFGGSARGFSGGS